MSKKNFGFTLIELLIVVAIIAILAAIAIPNFLAAQVRSKVGRTKSEMKSFATALESYYVDNNAYPNMVGANGQPNMWGFLHVSNDITTPISYISKQPLDIFRLGKVTYAPTEPMRPHYFYQNWDFYYKSDPVAYSYGYNLYGAWKVMSTGPGAVVVSWTTIYDPTNGTISNGNISRTQKFADGVWF
ncbi:MAG: prepilin-type N-terminal cleavage/methylation domain-containing protein [bacterium]|nr:prepilin-type N-terminal cleavage/methylation domain-containing protein [bacterium]